MGNFEKNFPIKNLEIDPSEKNPFENCKLNRFKYAKILTNLVSSDSEGFVLSLNNKWGTGKTTFVKMWNQHLKNEGFSTVMFNAWENDFVSNPLTALIAEFRNLNEKDINGFKAVVEKASNISKGIIPTLAKAFLYKHFDAEEIKELIEGSVDSITKSFKNEVDDYEKQKKSIISFKVSLAKYVADNSNGKPVIFIIDELDRCRPNYAVSILESIKHLFSVPNVVFVLSIDKLQLENAICGVYGSDNIDAIEYLRKFIDIEYSLPKPKASEYFDFLYIYYNFDSFFSSQPRRFNYLDNKDKELFIRITKFLINNESLRNQEKIVSHLRISLMLHGDVNQSFNPTLYVFLVYCKLMERSFYEILHNQELELKEFHEEFFKLTKKFKKSEKRVLASLEAYLLLGYSFSKYKKNEVFKIDFNNIFISDYTSKFLNDEFQITLRFIESENFFDQIALDKIIKKVSLTDDFNLS